jgi:hypothetical protein
MAKGWMSKDPSEMTARQQRRMQFLEKRGRGGRVSGQPTEMPEMTARQQRRQRYVANRDARRQRAVEDYRAQQAGQQAGQQLGRFPGLPEGLPENYQPYPLQLTPEQQREWQNNMLSKPFFSDNYNAPQDAMLRLPAGSPLLADYFGGQGYGNMMGQLPAGQTQGQAVGAAMGQRGVNAARPYGTNHWSYNRR